jgi:hypothetical protein
MKQKMKTGRLAMETFDLIAHQWTLDQYEMFDTIQDADCMGGYKVAPTDFVDHMMETYTHNSCQASPRSTNKTRLGEKVGW